MAESLKILASFTKPLELEDLSFALLLLAEEAFKEVEYAP